MLRKTPAVIFSVRTTGTKTFGAPYCLKGHEGAWQLLPETRGSPPLPPLNWNERHRRGANTTPSLEGTGWSLMVLSQQGRLLTADWKITCRQPARCVRVQPLSTCLSEWTQKKARDAVTRQQRHTRSARPSAWKHRSFSKWRLTERPACLSPLLLRTYEHRLAVTRWRSVAGFLPKFRHVWKFVF